VQQVAPEQHHDRGVSLREALATGAWLKPPLVTFAAALMAGGTLLALWLLFITAHGTLDSFGRPLGTDFSSFWTAGRMVLQGQASLAYDWDALFALQRQTHGVELYFPWSYPPVFLLIATALAALPYVPALLVWQAASLAGGLALVWRIVPSKRALLLALGFPAVLICLGHGQTGFLTAVLLAGGVLALPRHDILAGILFGLLIYKPQFGLLLPFVLAADGHWRAILAAAATVLVAFAVTMAIWGWPVWQAFLDSIPLTRTIVFEAGDTGFEKFQSVFAIVRVWGGSVPSAYLAQGALTAGVLAVSVLIWRSGTPLRLKGAALLTGTLLCSPYVLDYDLIVFGMALALFSAHGLEHGFMRWEKTLLAFGWIAPLVARSLGGLLHLPIGLAAMTAVFVSIALRVLHEQRAGVAVEAETAGVSSETASARF
jgi:hypothetical protein